MADEWYYVQVGQRLGPVPMQTLQSLLAAGSVHGSDLVWTEGMNDWVAAGTVGALVVAPTPQLNTGYPPPQQYPGASYQSGYTLAYPPGYGPPPGGANLAFSPAVAGYAQQQLSFFGTSPGAYRQYAGFWIRAAAALIDGMILSVVWCVVVVIVGSAVNENMWSMSGSAAAPRVGIINALSLVVGWLYFAGMESSSNQATLGKRAVGIRVTNMRGERIGFAQASVRNLAKLLSWLPMGIGFVMAGLSERRQALHDMATNCLVLSL